MHTNRSDEPEGPFDAIIVTIGTCGEPMKEMHFDGEDEFVNAEDHWLVHSSELDRLEKQGNGREDENRHRSHREHRFSDDFRDSRSYKDVVVDGMKNEASEEDENDDGEKKERGHSLPRRRHDDKSGSKTPNRGPFEAKDKKFVVIGSGASGVEAAEWARERGASKVWVMARDDKWILPRNVIVDTMLSAQPFGRETMLRRVTSSKTAIKQSN